MSHLVGVSEYVRSLDPVAKKRYTEKLECVGLSELEDPYELWRCSKFEQDNDMSKWPPIEYGDIFFYFIERPGYDVISLLRINLSPRVRNYRATHPP